MPLWNALVGFCLFVVVSEGMEDSDQLQPCTTKYDADFCSKVAAACSMILKMNSSEDSNEIPKEIVDCVNSENVQAMCYARNGLQYCKTEYKACIDLETASQRPLTTVEKECVKSHDTMATCNSSYGDECYALQKECIAATGAPAVRTGAKGEYQLATALRDCISDGGIMSICTRNHNRAQCSRWEVQCASKLQIPLSTILGFNYHKLPPKLASCVAKEDVMKRCVTKLGDEGCDEVLMECKRIVNSTSFDEFTPQMLRCVSRRIQTT